MSRTRMVMFAVPRDTGGVGFTAAALPGKVDGRRLCPGTVTPCRLPPRRPDVFRPAARSLRPAPAPSHRSQEDFHAPDER
ncbi:hypothetical protein [Deinococcus aluminii]|uniref:Uncharacterized protein n=1 Tax=Deinococcus aluminii TaxID=1656885 RepID=A0ABP9XGR7_9DEIO